MQLISSTAREGRAGPTYATAFPAAPTGVLTSLAAFTKGHPYAHYADLRANAPVSWQPEAFGGPGFWAVTRYEDVRRVNGDPETFSSQRGGILMNTATVAEGAQARLARASLDQMLNMDGPNHLQLRREHMPFFTPAYLAKLREKIAAEVTRLLDAAEAHGSEPFDWVEAFSSRLPLFTLCEILGVPEPDRADFLRWMHYLERAQDIAQQQMAGTLEASPELLTFFGEFGPNVEAMFAYGERMLNERRANPREDLMTAIAQARVDGTMLSQEYLDGSWLLIVFAGNDTTRNTLSGAMRLLTEFPEQKARLIAEPGLLPNAADEFIRMVSPVIYMRRTAAKDVEVAGQRIAEGEKVIMYYGAANRDSAMFADPDRLDVGRANADKHIAFGYGPHTCLGKRVAQIQLEEAYRQILARFPNIRWTGDIEIAPNNFVHAISRLGVKLAD